MIRQLKQVSDTIAIQFDVDWQEYQVTVTGNPEATYYTDDKQDAFDTADYMIYHKIH